MKTCRKFIPALLVALLVVALALGDPPKAPDKVAAAPGNVVTFTVTVEKGKKLGFQRVFEPSDCTLVRLWSDDPDVYEFLAQTKKAGTFGVAFWTVGEAKGTTTLIGDGGKPPPVDPPVDPPTSPNSVNYVIAVRPDGPVQQSFDAVMRNPGWNDLRAKGLKVGDMTATEARAEYKYPASAPVPGVFTLVASSDGKRATVVGDPIALPTTREAIVTLAGRFK